MCPYFIYPRKYSCFTFTEKLKYIPFGKLADQCPVKPVAFYPDKPRYILRTFYNHPAAAVKSHIFISVDRKIYIAFARTAVGNLQNTVRSKYHRTRSERMRAYRSHTYAVERRIDHRTARRQRVCRRSGRRGNDKSVRMISSRLHSVAVKTYIDHTRHRSVGKRRIIQRCEASYRISAVH